MSQLLVDGPAIARELGLHPVTLRNWASAGWIRRHGRDRAGRTLYDVDEVIAVRDTPKADRRRIGVDVVQDYTYLQDHQSVHSPAPTRPGLFTLTPAPCSLVIRSTSGAPRWWRVVIHATLEDLRQAAYRHRPWLGREHWDSTEGCCHPAGRRYDDGRRSFPRNGYGGIIRYAAPSLTPEIVAHELVHAAAHTLRSHGVGDVRLGDGYRGSNLREEQLAYIYGELFADLDRQL